jgi:uncharacterized protein (TIGR03067 family)
MGEHHRCRLPSKRAEFAESRGQTIFTSILFLAAISSFADQPPKETPKLDGEWKATAYVEDGEKADRLDKTPIKWAFKGDRVTIIASDQQEFRIKGTFKTAKSGKNIDLSFEGPSGDEKETKAPGIYELKGDQLKICYDPAGKKRPEKFDAPAKSKFVFIIFKRTAAKEG